MRHFCLIFFIILLNKIKWLIISVLPHGFMGKLRINGTKWTKKYKPQKRLVLHYCAKYDQSDQV